MKNSLLMFLVCGLVPVTFTASVQTGCVTIKNRHEGRFLAKSISTHDRDRRHVSFSKDPQSWIISAEGANFRIKHKGLDEELFESQQRYNGNYVFLWMKKSLINDGGASWKITESKFPGYFYIRNVKFNHCLYTKGATDWVTAYEACDTVNYEWRIVKC
uniref:Putative 16 kDa salivary peptide n=1 Tax=Culex tarsalis TaxID=7177 RepID=A0A1Q3FAN4_CULTA